LQISPKHFRKYVKNLYILFLSDFTIEEIVFKSFTAFGLSKIYRKI